MPPLVCFLVEICWEFTVGLWGNNRGNAELQHVISQPVRIKCAVRQQVSSVQILKQGAGLTQIVGLAGHQAEINEVAECIRQRQYFGGYAASGTSDGLAESPPFAP